MTRACPSTDLPISASKRRARSRQSDRMESVSRARRMRKLLHLAAKWPAVGPRADPWPQSAGEEDTTDARDDRATPAVPVAHNRQVPEERGRKGDRLPTTRGFVKVFARASYQFALGILLTS
ncbi:hypothetical protein GCM10017653_41330 [Ancylobacter defluvii]|uniref:Uncharacterized protein n=1 Tax=Ancylobacter defluvii TaxID=1282440 RepID=A0A9W6K315_9HYPH|nr:hypothetical protein GCM10017653_41330 [Ancylobacter defluvii]